MKRILTVRTAHVAPPQPTTLLRPFVLCLLPHLYAAALKLQRLPLRLEAPNAVQLLCMPLSLRHRPLCPGGENGSM